MFDILQSLILTPSNKIGPCQIVINAPQSIRTELKKLKSSDLQNLRPDVCMQGSEEFFERKKNVNGV